MFTIFEKLKECALEECGTKNVGHSHRLHCEKGPAEVVFPSPAEEVQPTTGAAETVLLCHH